MIADLEAGIGTLTRLADEIIDAVVVVVEPTPRSLEVGSRARDLAVERGATNLVVVANRVHDQADRDRIVEMFGDIETVIIPLDQQIIDAERRGLAPLDVAPESTAVTMLAKLAERLLDAG